MGSDLLPGSQGGLNLAVRKESALTRLTTVQCIMSHESGGNANAVNQNVGGSLDVGLWQINTQNWASCSGGSPPCDPGTNLACAIDVSARCGVGMRRYPDLTAFPTPRFRLAQVWKWGGSSFKLWSTW